MCTNHVFVSDDCMLCHTHLGQRDMIKRSTASTETEGYGVQTYCSCTYFMCLYCIFVSDVDEKLFLEEKITEQHYFV